MSWNYEVKKKIKTFKPRKPDAPDGTWRMEQEDVDRVQEFRKCIECFLCQDVCHVLRDHHKHDEFIGPRFLVYAAALEMHPLDTEDRVADLKEAHGIGYCNITKCCTQGLPRAHHDHRQRDHPAQGAGGRPLLRPDRAGLLKSGERARRRRAQSMAASARGGAAVDCHCRPRRRRHRACPATRPRGAAASRSTCTASVLPSPP